MRWLDSRLNRKFALGTAVGLLVSSMIFLMLYMSLYRSELSNERAEAAAQVNNLLEVALENAMLKRDLEGLRLIVERLGDQPDVLRVFIANPKGEIRFASDTAMLSKQVMPEDLSDSHSTRFLVDSRGRDALRSINPVANRPQCRECHGLTADNPVNGILYVDYDAAPLRGRAQRTTLLLMSSGALIVLINLAGGWWFIRRFVITPIGQLTSSSRALARGDYTHRTRPKGDDELAQLGHTFNAMADELQAKILQLEQQGAFLQSLLDAIPDGVRVIGPDFHVLLTNKAYRCQLDLGSEDGVGATCHGVSHRSDTPCPSTLVTCPVHEIQQHNKPVKALHRHHRIDGSVIDVEIFAAPMQAQINGKETTLVVESIRDLSKQIQYSQEQKLSELGKLATGVAHEIHNPLASVRLALHALRDHSTVKDIEPEVREYLELVDQEVDKCVNVTERLLRLGATPPELPELVDVATVVEDTVGLLRWEAEELHLQVNTKLDRTLRVLASDSELRMVTLNLIQNAFHAMPKGGELSISTQRGPEWVEIQIRDTGIGIAGEKLHRIFDPFYSRRADNTSGTGLGLSIVRTIVEKYDGDIDVSSRLGEGSTFTVRFPDPEQMTKEAL